MLEGGHASAAHDEVLLSRDKRGTPNGLIYFGAQLVVASEGEAALGGFAVETRKHPGLRSFVGPKQAVDGLWKRVRRWYVQPSIVRAEQPVYAVTPTTLRDFPDVDVRPAREDEASIVAENSGEMILGELGYDPRLNRAAFVAAVRRAITQGLWWVWIVHGTLRFQLNIGPRSEDTTQLQGVWTPAGERRRGYATLALAAVARRLLANEPSLSLYVNGFNGEAIALYERVGFERVSTFATYLFP